MNILVAVGHQILSVSYATLQTGAPITQLGKMDLEIGSYRFLSDILYNANIIMG
jgi:hypothetical protein